MTQTDGERELVLGNKQLISLFFVVVALCGVFFAMGYMMGRNTAKPAIASLEANAAPSAPAASTSVSPVPQSQDAEPPGETPDGPPPDTQSPAAADSTAITPTAPTTSAAASNPAASLNPATSTTAAIQTRAAQDTPVTPDAGAIWLQVTALRRADADNLVKTLREQKFPTVLANSSKPDLFRVLVGPYHQMTDVADAKAHLKALGFANAFVQK